MTEFSRHVMFVEQARPQDLSELALHRLNGTSEAMADGTRGGSRRGRCQSNELVAVTFLGTRGEIRARSRRHRRHSCIILVRGKARVMIDCGADWLHLLSRVSPTAILLTHAHPDHAAGLARGASCPVYAPARAWRSLPAWPISDRRVMPLQKSVAIAGMRFEALAVEHSVRAPTVGYRVWANRVRLFYVPDVVRLRSRRRALRGVDLYVGDGASITRPIIRRRGRAVIGHSSVRAQLDWCKAERVRIAYFTHCGSEIVTAHAWRIHQVVRRLGAERGVDARVARDGLRLILGGDKVHFVASAGVVPGKPQQDRCCPSHARR